MLSSEQTMVSASVEELTQRGVCEIGQNYISFHSISTKPAKLCLASLRPLAIETWVDFIRSIPSSIGCSTFVSREIFSTLRSDGRRR